jgi:hypothetical protein
MADLLHLARETGLERLPERIGLPLQVPERANIGVLWAVNDVAHIGRSDPILR